LDYQYTLKKKKKKEEGQKVKIGLFRWWVGIRKGGMRMNMVDIFCIHYENRMKPANIVLRSREEGERWRK
jgi:hypothetical protein